LVFFNSLLWVGSILCFIAYSLNTADKPTLFLGVVLALVVVGTGLFSFYQESKSANLMAGFSNLMPPNVMVKRDNDNWISLPPVQLVPGDIVQLNMGMAIPADMRIIECSSDMQVDNSSLTGETEPQKRDWKKTEHVPAEAANLIFFWNIIS